MVKQLQFGENIRESVTSGNDQINATLCQDIHTLKFADLHLTVEPTLHFRMQHNLGQKGLELAQEHNQQV